MEKVYQINVVGSYVGFNDPLKVFSKNVYRHHPTEEEIKEFVEKCKQPIPDDEFANAFCLDTNKMYTVRVVELFLND